jgi:alkaline phosphatase D
VRTRNGEGETVALEFVGGSVTVHRARRDRLRRRRWEHHQGQRRQPEHAPAIINALRDINPWVDNADFDHHGYGKVTASKAAFDVDMVRLQTIKRRTTARIPGDDFRYRVARGQNSIKGVNGPPAT